MDARSTTWYDPVKQRGPTWRGAENTTVGQRRNGQMAWRWCRRPTSALCCDATHHIQLSGSIQHKSVTLSQPDPVTDGFAMRWIRAGAEFRCPIKQHERIPSKVEYGLALFQRTVRASELNDALRLICRIVQIEKEQQYSTLHLLGVIDKFSEQLHPQAVPPPRSRGCGLDPYAYLSSAVL